MKHYDDSMEIEKLLKKLPVASLPNDFTNKLMSRIAELSPKAAFTFNRITIFLIIAGACLLLGIAGWLTFFVFGVEITFLKSISAYFTASIASFTTLFKEIRIPLNVLGGLIAGAFLLLIDAWLHNRQHKQQRSAI